MADESQTDATKPLPLTAGSFDVSVGPPLLVWLPVACGESSSA